MAKDKQALLQSYRDTRAEMLAAIDGLNEAQMSERSIDGWSVNDHLLHLALWDDVRAQEVERISAGYESAWRMTDEQDTAFNEMSYALRAKLPVPQVLWEIETSRRRLLDSIVAATERGLDASLYGDAGLASGHEAEHCAWIKRWRGEKGY
ncbi:MAG TPA: maleylpyruvate isomerase N-terminal domain-containing protein [Dehalococcoidia bacterium]